MRARYGVSVNEYDALEARWQALRKCGRGIAVRSVACVGAPRTLLLAEAGTDVQPVIALAAGLHGDEPAGVWALLALAEDGQLDERFAYRIWCCVNPSGFALGTRENQEGADINRSFDRGGQTPEARAIITSNRDRKFALSMDFHEDSDASGFYCYEYGGGTIGRGAVQAVSAAGWPLAQAVPGGSHRGWMVPDPLVEAESLGGLSYSLAIARRAAKSALTFETPAGLARGERIAMHRAAAMEAIRSLRLE